MWLFQTCARTSDSRATLREEAIQTWGKPVHTKTGGDGMFDRAVKGQLAMVEHNAPVAKRRNCLEVMRRQYKNIGSSNQFSNPGLGLQHETSVSGAEYFV